MPYPILKFQKKIISLLLFTGGSLFSYGQTPLILKGRVMAELSREPLPGVIVHINGTKVGTTTDTAGRFELQTTQPIPFTLFIDFIGFQTKEIDVYEASEPLEIMLQTTNSLKQVVVVGYGEQSRKDITGSISSVPAELKSQPVSSVERLLEGSTAGVAVTQTSGQPGAGVSVQIRGNNSITAGSDPLYVIDGFPINNDYGVNDAGVIGGPKIDPLSTIPTSDIESIDVLKDASATAIYGSRGANGVVIITTKKGSRDQSLVTYDEYTGVSEVTKEIPLLNAGEWWQLRKDAAINSGTSGALEGKNASILATAKNQGYAIDTSGQGTDWQKAAFRSAITQNHNLSILSGTDKTRLAIAFNYLNQDGVLINTGFVRYAGRVNVEHKYSRKFKVSANINGSISSANVAPANVVSNLLLTPPGLPIYKSDGTFVLQSPFESANPAVVNPINTLTNEINQSKTNRLLGNTALEYAILDHLTAKVLFGADILDNKQNQYLPLTTAEGLALGGYGAVGSQFTINWLNENTLSYSRILNGVHSLNVLAGFSAQHSATEGEITSAAGFPNDLLTYNNLGVGVTPRPVTTSSDEWALASWLGRINYGFKEKYLVTLTLRADGSSKFGPDNKWGYFPSTGLAWNANQEHFLRDVKWLSNLKVRASVGNTGNQSIPSYSSLAQLASYRYNFSNTTVSGYAPLTVSNPNLGWEKTTQTDFGTDLGLFKNRINLTADLYYKLTTNLLLSEPVSGTSGLSYYDPNANPGQLSTVYQNIGAVENKGYEAGVVSQNLIGRLKWNTIFILSQNFSKILSLGNGINQTVPDANEPSVLQVGAPLGSFLVYETNGLIKAGGPALTPQQDKNPGGQNYVDVDGDGKITSNDRVLIKNNPPVVLGLTNTVQFGGFDLTIFFQASIGGKLYNANRAALELGTGYTNASADFLKAWTGTNADVKAPYQDPAIVVSDRFIEDASYLRLKNITIGYTLPSRLTEKVKIKKLRLYVSAQNAFTWTRYTGYDPEVSLNGQSLIEKGYDQGVYPNSRTILGGITVTF
jgi:TonB-linked SusC/RagA family outer membrane protein